MPVIVGSKYRQRALYGSATVNNPDFNRESRRTLASQPGCRSHQAFEFGAKVRSPDDSLTCEQAWISPAGTSPLNGYGCARCRLVRVLALFGGAFHCYRSGGQAPTHRTGLACQTRVLRVPEWADVGVVRGRGRPPYKNSGGAYFKRRLILLPY